MRFSGIGNVKLGTFKVQTTTGSRKLRDQQTLVTWAVLHNPTGNASSLQWGPNPNEFLTSLDLAVGKWYNLAPEAVIDLADLYVKSSTNTAGVTLEVLYAYQA